jgi:hypothetical protein
MVQPRRDESPKPAPEAPAAEASPPPAAPPLEQAPAVGETKIFKAHPETAAVSAEDAEEMGLARTPAALLLNGQRHELAKRTVVLGRSRECDIRVEDPNVSRRHAEIRQEDGAYWIVDLGSTNGIEVNGRRTERAKLGDDDRIVLGQTDLRFEAPF